MTIQELRNATNGMPIDTHVSIADDDGNTYNIDAVTILPGGEIFICAAFPTIGNVRRLQDRIQELENYIAEVAG